MNDFSKLHASIVDDQDVELFITEQLLRVNRLAGKIELFRSGQEFINSFKEKIQNRDYALINYRMPVMSGLETIQNIRSLGQWTENTRFFLTSSTSDISDLNKVALSEVVDGLLLKPLSLDGVKTLLGN